MITFFIFLAFQIPTPASRILGNWRGSSTCVDKAHDTACRDEVVIYEVDSAASPRGPVRLVADKIVNGRREPMGVLRFTYDSAKDVWFADIATRVHERWRFATTDSTMTGTLAELASRRIVRRVTVRRARGA